MGSGGDRRGSKSEDAALACYRDSGKNKLPLPSMFVSNARPLIHKMDEMELLIKGNRHIQDCSGAGGGVASGSGASAAGPSQQVLQADTWGPEKEMATQTLLCASLYRICTSQHLLCILHGSGEDGRMNRPPSSYGSMRSEEEEEEEDLERCSNSSEGANAPFVPVQGGAGAETSGVNSPEPPPPVEDGDQMEDEEADLERLHPELDMPHVFKSIMDVLSRLSVEDMTNFKIRVHREEKNVILQDLLQWDNLDLVDKLIEQLVMLCFHLKQQILRKFKVLYEGVPRPGKQQLLDTIYVQPMISRRPGAGIESASGGGGSGNDSSPMNVTDLLRLRRDNGDPVRTLVTTGLPGIGMSVVAARFSMDWAERGANKDIQFVIPLSFESLWSFQKFQLPPSKKMSIMEVIGHYYQGFGDKTPVVSDSRTAAHLDVLIVNLIRGNLLPSACIWILGRQAAVSNIPPEFIDVVTDIHGFSDEMKDDYLRQRFQDEKLAENIVSHYKRRPVLRALCQQPFVCWLAATAFQRCYRYQGYGKHPPRITPFYIHVMVIQTNRKLQRYCGQSENHLKWSSEDVLRMRSLGKLALTMVKNHAWVFSQQDLKEHNLDTKEITLFSGLCTEKVPLLGTSEPKQFCFIHTTFQEFLAAMYIFMVFHLEGLNVLEEPSRKPFLSKVPRAAESAVDLLRCVVKQTQGAQHMDMVLLFLCGMMSRGNHNDMLRGKLFQASAPQLAGLEGTRKRQELEEAQKLLEQESERAPADRRANLEDCLRELVQEDE
ncbi:unnamed protein product [Merluccius merluccius]